ncbi:uncharacterized protein LOC135494377 [Lineus longissimus]|uniref:uncharacterized protein LOC135494377 n=1 Tax=Lineus longissimus TaxID=88925 RepID=UPI002B4DC8BE
MCFLRPLCWLPVSTPYITVAMVATVATAEEATPATEDTEAKEAKEAKVATPATVATAGIRCIAGDVRRDMQGNGHSTLRNKSLSNPDSADGYSRSVVNYYRAAQNYFPSHNGYTIEFYCPKENNSGPPRIKPKDVQQKCILISLSFLVCSVSIINAIYSKNVQK